MPKRVFENRFNDLGSKEYLKFQKSWFYFHDKQTLFRENVRFFSKHDGINQPKIVYFGPDKELMSNICKDENRMLVDKLEASSEANVQFMLIDLLDVYDDCSLVEDLHKKLVTAFKFIHETANYVQEKRFISVLIPNFETGNYYFPAAWDLALNIARILELKDEKLGCIKTDNVFDYKHFNTDRSTFYCLYFRKQDAIDTSLEYKTYYKSQEVHDDTMLFTTMNQWNIIKPKPRSKTELLHPAKYPEELIEMFVKQFTEEGGSVFDPMSGTGSTQVASLTLKRRAYGTELSEMFANIARNRCKAIFEPFQLEVPGISEQIDKVDYNIVCADARNVDKLGFPDIDYMVTSPPYWDMLNMKGAENQMNRKRKGLQLNYSEDSNDLGNIGEYNMFIDELVDIYKKTISIMKPGGYLTIIVKNIKKGGVNYPFAWDLSRKLGESLTILPEVFWLQDDLSIAPYGYGNTWVSNTFHQYCLNFQIRR